MKTTLYILLGILIILATLFIWWFLGQIKKGRCPLCAMKKIVIPRKVTIDLTQFEDYPAPLKKPLMGWSSWNTFRQNINEDIILETADAMVKSGLKEAGYEYINVDDCWQSSLRDVNGRLQADFSAFPSGIPALVKQVNDKGLRLGLYTSNGELTCEDLPASLGREDSDAQTLAEWGCEFFKYDFCHNKLDSGIAPAIESLEFSALGEKPLAVITPDDVKYFGMAKPIRDKRLESGKAIGYLSHGAGKVSFKITAEKSGEYVLTVNYRKRKVKKAPYLLVKIGGEFFEVLFPVANAFTAQGRAQAIIKLQQGENEIEISNPIVNRSDSAFLQYLRMGKALKNAAAGKKPIVFSICEWGFNRPYIWGAKAGNMWRTTPDIREKWWSILSIYSHNIKLWKYASAGHFNDPDMLEVGNGKLTDAENKSHFSLWCMMAAPLVLGNDIRKFVDEKGEPEKDNRTLGIVTNKELINIDGDSLAKPAKRVKKGRADVIARPLANGDIALCFFNKYGGAKKLSFNLKSLEKDDYFGIKNAKSFEATELWSGEKQSGEKISATVPKHSVKVYRIKVK